MHPGPAAPSLSPRQTAQVPPCCPGGVKSLKPRAEGVQQPPTAAVPGMGGSPCAPQPLRRPPGCRLLMAFAPPAAYGCGAVCLSGTSSPLRGIPLSPAPRTPPPPFFFALPKSKRERGSGSPEQGDIARVPGQAGVQGEGEESGAHLPTGAAPQPQPQHRRPPPTRQPQQQQQRQHPSLRPAAPPPAPPLRGAGTARGCSPALPAERDGGVVSSQRQDPRFVF